MQRRDLRCAQPKTCCSFVFGVKAEVIYPRIENLFRCGGIAFQATQAVPLKCEFRRLLIVRERGGSRNNWEVTLDLSGALVSQEDRSVGVRQVEGD